MRTSTGVFTHIRQDSIMAKIPLMFLLDISEREASAHQRENSGAHTPARTADTTNAMPCSGLSPRSGTGSTWQPVWQEPPGLDDNGPTCHLPGEMPQEAALMPPAPLPTLPQGLRPMDCVMLHSHDNWELLHGPQTHCCQRDTPARLPGRKHKRSEGLRLGRPWARP